MRPCLERGCPELTKGTYCKPHYNARRRPIYNRAHAKRSREVRAAQPWCSLCWATEDLVADHIVPGDPNSPLRTLCRPCNTARANRGRAA